jgi:NADPH:quinone reductase-like Zn-dependent oxidoreductase
MRAYEFTPDGAAYALRAVERPEPRAAPGRVIVRVRAVSLNYRDVINVQNQAGRQVGGRVAASDGAGEVVAVGEGVTTVRVGQRVAGCFFQGWIDGPFQMGYHKTDLGGTLDGMLTEYADLAATGVVEVPPAYTDEQAACLPCAALTAWQALVERGHLQPNQTVLLLGTGGVSIFGLQLAHALGATTIITSRSEAKLARARELGAAHTIHTAKVPQWAKQVQELTQNRGADHVLEVGGGGTMGQSLASVSAGGHVALIGVLTGFGPPTESLFPLVAKNAKLSGIYVGSQMQFGRMNQFLAGQAFRPVIDTVYEWSEAPEALAALARGEHFGKLVVRVGLSTGGSSAYNRV